MPTLKSKTPKFKAGEVVRISCPYYKKQRKAEQYQRIVSYFLWPECKSTPFGYLFVNGDRCNEKFVKPLTPKEKGEK